MKRLELLLGSENAGMLYGLLGILGFSITLPATRLAVQYMDPVFVGFGRALVAAIMASVLLILTKQKRPTVKQLKSLFIVALGVIVGFPLLSAWALQSVPASHGAIIIGILPLATVIVSIFRTGEQPSFKFWMFSILGTLIVLGYTFIAHSGKVEIADLALLGAVILAAFGYSEGAKLAQTIGGWKVISWALVLAAPFLLLPVFFSLERNSSVIPMNAWLGFFYVSIISQFVAFFVWYKGLALGGVAKVSQVQLLQPFFTVIASALLINENITPLAIVAMILIIAVVALGKSSAVKRRAVQ